METKEALERFFIKQHEFYQTNFGTFPTAPYNDEDEQSNPTIIPGSLDEEEYIQWKPVSQNILVDFTEFEKKNNIKLNSQIKQYFTTYWFLSDIAGVISETTLYFKAVPYGINILSLVENCFINAKDMFSDNNTFFQIGFAVVGGDDSYIIFVDNATAAVKCVQLENKNVIELGTLSEVLITMAVGM